VNDCPLGNNLTGQANMGELTAKPVGQTAVECVREMARCLRDIEAGRVPK
jgi:hypothetical protein